MSTSFDLPYFPRDGLLQDVLRIYWSIALASCSASVRFSGRRQNMHIVALPAADSPQWA